MKITRILGALCAAVFTLIAIGGAYAQQNTAETIPGPIIVTAGNTFQQILPFMTAGTNRKSITIQNNNVNTDSCWILVGGPWVAGDTATTSRTVNGVSLTAKQAAIILTTGSPYTRYYPYVPPDQILGTCTTTSDTIYADTQ